MAVVLLVCALTPAQPEKLCDRVDVIQVEHFYDLNGKLVFDQYIFYDWINCELRCVDWRLKKTEALPQFNDGEWVLRIYEDGSVREIRANQFIETWSQSDTELYHRDLFPKERRRGLMKRLKCRR